MGLLRRISGIYFLTPALPFVPRNEHVLCQDHPVSPPLAADHAEAPIINPTELHLESPFAACLNKIDECMQHMEGILHLLINHFP